MLRVAGVVPSHQLLEIVDWNSFREIYGQYRDEMLRERDALIEYRSWIRKLLHAFTLSRADVVGTTLDNCAENTLEE